MALERVLHVEDDESIRAVVEIALRDIAGFQVLSCASGLIAIAEAEQFQPQLMVLDVMMPDMDGLQTLAALRNLPAMKHVPAVFMTAKIQPEEKRKYLNEGAIAVIEKPFDPMLLGEQLNTIYQQETA